jgi:hypothetical protein
MKRPDFNLAKNRLQYVLGTGILFFALITGLSPGTAFAYNMLTSRSITMSTTSNGATNVAYKVSFTTVTDNQTIGSVVVEFCANSPIIGDSCSIASGFNTNYGSLSLNNVTGNISGLSIDTTDSTSNKVVLTRTAGSVSNGPVSFELGNGTTNGISNPPTDNTTFYAKIFTLTNTTGALTPTEPAAATDAGGVALSTASQLNVTAKVQETLTFCVYTAADCATGGTAVALGDSNGVLSSTSTTYTATANYDLASNAFGGVSVKMLGDTLKSGSFSITPDGSSCAADVATTSVEQFGVRIATVGAAQTAAAPYDCASSHHGFDLSSTNTLYGDEIATTSGATDVSSSQLEFAAKSAGTTEAGVYTTTLSLIATATY